MIDDATYEREYESFKTEVKHLINGVDLNQYKPAQMKRRIKSFISKYDCSNTKDFVTILKGDRGILDAFRDHITINVTEFFRNADKFMDLRRNILPGLIENAKEHGRNGLRIWSAGCSLGAEPYTLSIIMKEYFPDVSFSIQATDIDAKILESAKMGKFRDIELKSVDSYILHKYFDEIPEQEKWQVKQNIKTPIMFKINNLLQDTFNTGFDLILCRNVVIYFTEEAKDTLYRKFYNSLATGGVLFIGGTESILNASKIGFTTSNNLFYYK